ncbi:YgaP family membrane protein [Methylotetracoccus oryzae]|uniref:YgaP family membrane protein n=1 Tax=Methylotetracoccus oryzae TaxID=1919059 RepID=UPI0019128635|nr:DUF2892 domain-containing protein [Methylotetracoccus oryzae]
MNLVKNVGKVDKTVRIAVGALLVVLAATGTIGVWGWIGLLPLATGFMGTCPAYTVMGISTTDTKA